MAAVNFGTWNPASDRRAAVELMAKELPTDWLVVLVAGEGAYPASYRVVVEDGNGRRVAFGSFNSQSLEGVPAFLQRLSRHLLHGLGKGPASAL